MSGIVINHSIMDIPKFYKDANIFMTGATGFLGHVLLAKLLRSCPDIRTIYILMREKKGIEPIERFKRLFDDPVFEKVKEECPNYLSKVKAIIGDCLKPNLGLNPKDEEVLINEVHMIFHCAATVRFDAPLQYAVNMNIRCTNDLLEIAHKMKNLVAFVYVSTAFSNCAGRKVVEEKFYEASISAEDIMTITEKISPETVDKITPHMLGKHPNTYVYTKSISEDLCRRKSNGIPLVIFRPAIVISTEKEPVPGWINNIYGPTGLVAAAGVGLLRSLHGDPNCIASIVPCDYVINALIASAWKRGTDWENHKLSLENDLNNSEIKETHVQIYNYSNNRNPVTWGIFAHENEKEEPSIPSNNAIWAYTLTMNKYKPIHQLYCLLVHLLPALIVDSVAKLLGKEPKLWDAYQKIHKLLDVLAFFSTQQWKMKDDNVVELWNELSESDKKTFYFDIEDLDWKRYFIDHVQGIRLYVMKEPVETIPSARKRRSKLVFAHYTFKAIITVLTMYFSYNIFKFAIKIFT